MTTLEKNAHVPAAVGRVGRNAAVLAGATVFFKAGSLLVLPLILRAFTAAEYGLYSAAFAYAGLLGMVAHFGMNPVVVRDISRGERPRGSILFHCAALRLGLLAPAAGALAFLGWLKGFEPLMWLVAWVAFGAVALDAFTGTLKSSLKARGFFGRVTLVEGVKRCGRWVLAIVVVVAGAGIFHLALAALAAGALALLAAAVLALERTDFAEADLEGNYAGRMLRLSAPLGISAAFVVALDNVDVWLLDFLRGPADVAVFRAATVFTPLFVAQAVVWAFMPVAFRLARDRRSRLAAAAGSAAKVVLVLGAAGAVVAFSAADRIVPLLAGEKYSASIPVFRLMGVSLPLTFLGFLELHILTAVDRQKLGAGIFAGALGLNAAVDAALIPHFGPVGAMLGTLATEAAMAAAALAVVWRVVGRPFPAGFWRLLVAVGGAFSAVAFTFRLGIADMGATGLGVLVLLLVALKGVGGADLALLGGKSTE